MTTVILKTGLAGPRFALAPGDEYECDAAEAHRLVDAGFAKFQGTPPKRPGVEAAAEDATADPDPESADSGTPKKRTPKKRTPN